MKTINNEMRKYGFLIFVLKAIQSLVGMGLYYFFGRVADAFVQSPSEKSLKFVFFYSVLDISFIFVYFFCEQLVFILRKHFTLKNSEKLSQSILETPPGEVLDRGTDYYFTAFSKQIPNIEGTYLLGIASLLSQIIGIAFTIVVVASFHFSLPIIMLAGFVVGKLVTKLIEPYLDKRSAEEITLRERYNGKTMENQKGLPFFISNAKRPMLFSRQKKRMKFLKISFVKSKFTKLFLIGLRI